MSNKINNIGYKVTNPDMTCRGFQFEVGKKYKHNGSIKLCGSGFHFCLKLQDCFSYYSFDPQNKVLEIKFGKNVEHGDDKSVTDEITIIRELSWSEVLELANLGKDNTGHSNSGNWNSGNSNSGNRNSGDSNSGNWNSGYRNSGDSNSGYRNSGAFCTDSNPKLVLFDVQTDILIKDWEQSEVVRIMNNIDPTIWVPSSVMTKEEKESHPKWETTEGYLKTISMHDAWKNMWGNLPEEKRKLFLDLPNFNPSKFKEITGIDINK